jgi:hypothetical protein
VALALLAFPAAAPAVPVKPIVNPDLRGPQPSAFPYVGQHLPAKGTDVAARDQQAPAGTSAPVSESSASDFDWSDAGIGAAGAAGLFAVSLAGGITLRRRTQRRISALG